MYTADTPEASVGSEANVADLYAETMKAFGSAVIGLVAGYLAKVFETRREARRQQEKGHQELWAVQKQNYWSPLLETTREFRSRLEELSDVYRRKERIHFSPDSLSRDFRELYMLSSEPIQDRENVDPNGPRRDESAKQRLRTRMCHHLTFAVSSLYRTAKYIAVAEQVRSNLKEYRLLVPEEFRQQLILLIENVRSSLQGPNGAGIFTEQQESIAEIMSDSAGHVITNFEFRKRLLELPGWEQFTGLFRFFLSRGSESDGPERSEFKAKLDYEVKATIQALRALEDNTARLLKIFDGVTIKKSLDAGT